MPGVYRGQRPERSVLQRLLRGHLETFLDLARRDDAALEPVPALVEQPAGRQDGAAPGRLRRRRGYPAAKMVL